MEQPEVIIPLDPTFIFIRNLDISKLDVFAGIFVLFVTLILNLIIMLFTKYPLDRISNDSVFSSPKAFDNIEGYDFEPQYFYDPVIQKNMHYVDVGGTSNKVVLCLHGVPLWSHSFRKIIPGLVSSGYRVVVPDLIGFGKSSKFVDYRAHTLTLHVSVLRRFVQTVIPSGEIFLVGHNWGALLAPFLIMEHLERISKLTILNTNNLPDGELNFVSRFNMDIQDYFRYLIMDSYFLLFRAYSFLFGDRLPLEWLFFAMNPKYTKEDYKGFTAPFLHKSLRASIVAFPQLVPVFSSHENAKEFGMARYFFQYVWTKPTQIIFSEKASVPFFQRGDFIVGNRKNFFTQIIPHAVVADPPVPGGHIIMYDNPKGVLNHLIPFLDDDNYEK